MRVLIHSARYVLASFRVDEITIPFFSYYIQSADEFCEAGSKMRTGAIRAGGTN
jgi:hypothetical protein